MSKQLSKALVNLSEADKVMNSLTLERDDILERREKLQLEIDSRQNSLDECEAKLEVCKTQQQEESDRLKGEEMRLVEQRKQLTAMGSKSAKMVERQIDMASQTLQQMEERAVKAIEEVESLENQKDSIKEALEELSAQLKDEEQTSGDRLDKIEKEVQSLNKSRDGAISKLDERLKRLYGRVHVRFPDSAVALAQSGSCRCCYRSLPKQIYNQIMAGTVSIQCPGCSRILVYASC